ncbi:MAG TPA: GNAT family N-acetyltransferase [Chloroflexia bacterium]|nr:GNAT family N-acetyltransferase [Chloroflexia bacterium]
MGIDNIANPQPTIKEPRPDIEVLTLQTLRDLRLPWLSKFDHASLAGYISENPGLSLRVSTGNEYILGEKWRGRTDIANIVEIAARRNKRALVEEWVERLSRDKGVALLLVNQEAWHEDSRLFEQLGFSLIEKIIFLERGLPSHFDWQAYSAEQGLPVLSFERATVADVDPLLLVDHQSFPWLWWNSRDELGTYMSMPDVHVFLAKLANEPIGYASFTMYSGWAHLDRLAVEQGVQGRGYGAAQLAHALGTMIVLGARSVSLSTQEHNTQSQRLYSRFGFRIGRDAMGLYGRALRELMT